jgi:hypothetical protein
LVRDLRNHSGERELIGITGHTNGIGKEVFARLGVDALGFSTSNGYDITSPSSRRKIIDQVQDCEIFINNAQAGYGQVDLLIELFQAWKDQPRLIMNVGSRIAEITLPSHRLHLLHYSAQKKALKTTVAELQGYTCAVDYVWFAYVGTEKILAKYPHFTTGDYITVPAAADIIMQPVRDYLKRNGSGLLPAS